MMKKKPVELKPLIKIDISWATMSASNKKYHNFYVDTLTNVRYMVITGGNSCTAAHKSELEDRGANRNAIKEMLAGCHAHQWFFTDISEQDQERTHDNY